MKARRFLNVVTGRSGGGSLSRIINPMKHLFYPSTAKAHQHQIQQQEAAAAKAESRLEEKEKGAGGGFRRSLAAAGRAAAPRLSASSPFTAAVFEDHSFEILVYGDPNLPPVCESMNPMDTDRCMWHWRPLPRPPIVVDDGYYGRGDGDGSISAHTYVLLHGHHGDEDASNSSTTICVPFRIKSHREWSGREPDPISITYYFDTGTREWAKAGDWMLPFWPHVLHVPELCDNLLFGFENTGLYLHSRRFCAVDVSGAVRMDGSAPALRHAWIDIDPPSRWHEHDINVVYLSCKQTDGAAARSVSTHWTCSPASRLCEKDPTCE